MDKKRVALKRMHYNDISFRFGEICLSASVPVMEIYTREFTTEQKADGSPVTQADNLAEIIILDALKDFIPGHSVLAEESFSKGFRPKISETFLLVDPVDGTKEFIAKRNEFTINIALIENEVPVAGAVYAPALGELYLGGESAFKTAIKPGESLRSDELEPIRTRSEPKEGLTAMVSRSHFDPVTEDFLKQFNVYQRLSAGSSLKFCKLADGDADIYPRFAPTMEWDTAAGHAVLCAAGGSVTETDTTPLRYGKTGLGYKNPSFIGWGTKKNA